ncbi:M23 family metallopeptidase [Sphingomonas cavernae]|uniref:M23 family metallopeptidase n=1 Tax=Sphingomonas cavernae TaxID=2320861 RepID=A0A418WKI5_9SPHN|nr:M23 family metallopeptidase [Sphingomonas cavernae]RJF90554.1 M23 family metallopeptidase [Sphingomonas cavernae]
MGVNMYFKNVFSMGGFRITSRIPEILAIAAALVAAPAAQAADAETAASANAAVAALSTPATGGVFEKASPREAAADPQYRSLFLSWKKLDQVGIQGSVSIPSQKPVSELAFTSNFGFRSDPFRGSRAMHAGVDIPGPLGTAIYATADGVVGRAQRLGGYGNYVEIEHGQGIQTRYGHLSAILVAPNTRVKRGQLIGRMGSTGRSTGSHLHYEVRLDGRAVNPMPFLQSSDYLVALQQRENTGTTRIAMGGPDKE